MVVKYVEMEMENGQVLQLPVFVNNQKHDIFLTNSTGETVRLIPENKVPAIPAPIPAPSPAMKKDCFDISLPAIQNDAQPSDNRPTERQLRLLHKTFGVDLRTYPMLTDLQAELLISRLKARRDAKMASYEQIQTLRRYMIPNCEKLTRSQARSIIYRINKDINK